MKMQNGRLRIRAPVWSPIPDVWKFCNTPRVERIDEPLIPAQTREAASQDCLPAEGIKAGSCFPQLGYVHHADARSEMTPRAILRDHAPMNNRWQFHTLEKQNIDIRVKNVFVIKEKWNFQTKHCPCSNAIFVGPQYGTYFLEKTAPALDLFTVNGRFRVEPLVDLATQAMNRLGGLFEEEKGQYDGTAAHAFERLFGVWISAANLTVQDTQGNQTPWNGIHLC